MKLMVLNNSSKKSAGTGAEAEAPAAKAETTTGAEVRKRFEFVLFYFPIFFMTFEKIFVQPHTSFSTLLSR